jgi:hypothetical protein
MLPLSGDVIAGAPRFAFKESTAGVVVGRTLLPLVALAALTALMMASGVRRYRDYDVTG